MFSKYIVLFCNSINQRYGGMETHFKAFRKYFNSDNSTWKLLYTITCEDGFKVFDNHDNIIFNSNSINKLCNLIICRQRDKTVFFFNDGYWIAYLEKIRLFFPNAYIMMRSGGNEFVSAKIFGAGVSLKNRQIAWSYTVNTYTDSVIANSLYTVNRMKECGFHGDRIILIRGGVDHNECAKNVENKDILRRAIRKKYNITQKYLFVVAARLVKFKGLNFLIDAISQSEYCNEIFLLIIGDGEEEIELQKKCMQMLSYNHYRFVGAKKHIDTLRIICSADVFCNTSIEYKKECFGESYIHTETMGRSMMEAICENVPILATDVGGTKELFLENTSIGELVLPNIKSLVKGIANVLNKRIVGKYNSNIYDWESVFYSYKVIWNSNFEPFSIKEKEYLISNGRWSLCYRNAHYFQKYLKYATYNEAMSEGILSRIARNAGVNTPYFYRTSYSTKRQMFFNEYEYVMLRDITEKMLFYSSIWHEVKKIIYTLQQVKKETFPIDSDLTSNSLSEFINAIKFVEKEKGVSFSNEINYLKSLPNDVLVHGDYSLVNIFLDERTSKVIVVDFQNSFMGCKDWDYCYLLATIDLTIIPKDIIIELSLEQLKLIVIICLIKLGRGIRKNYEVNKRELQYNRWMNFYEQNTCF